MLFMMPHQQCQSTESIHCRTLIESNTLWVDWYFHHSAPLSRSARHRLRRMLTSTPDHGTACFHSTQATSGFHCSRWRSCYPHLLMSVSLCRELILRRTSRQWRTSWCSCRSCSRLSTLNLLTTSVCHFTCRAKHCHFYRVLMLIYLFNFITI